MIRERIGRRNACVAKRVLGAGHGDPPVLEVIFNGVAAPLLYVMGVSKDLKQGLEMARQAIADGKPVDKLRDWVTWQNNSPEDGLPTLEKMMGKL